MTYRYVVENSIRISEKVISLSLAPKGKAMEFIAGQYVYLSVVHPEYELEKHPFSIVSGPGEKNIKLLIKSLGDYTSAMLSLSIGTEVEFSGPCGNFSYKALPEFRQLWIASGIGIAPFISMAKALNIGERSIRLHYLHRSGSRAEGFDELRVLSHRLGRDTLEVTVHKTPLEETIMDGIIQGDNEGGIMVCGSREARCIVERAVKHGNHRGSVLFDATSSELVSS